MFHQMQYSKTIRATCGTITAYPSEAPEITPVLVGLVLLDLQCSVICFVDHPFFPFVRCLLAIVLSVLLFTASYYPLVSSNVYFIPRNLSKPNIPGTSLRQASGVHRLYQQRFSTLGLCLQFGLFRFGLDRFHV